MKHHCHCGFDRCKAKFKAKKLGVFGLFLVVAHLLWHVAECLVLPAVFLAVSSASPDTERTMPTYVTELTDCNFDINRFDVNLLTKKCALEYPFQLLPNNTALACHESAI